MICHTRKCIFVHIPKTAGTSIEQVLWPDPEDRTEEILWMGFVDDYHNKYQTGGLQHLKGWQVREEVGAEVFNSYFKFAVVRNPWDKVVSQYRYMQKRADLRDFIGMDADASLEEYLTLTEKRTHVQWEPQAGFVLDSEGKLLVDKLVRFETLAADMKSVFQRLGLYREGEAEVELPELLRSPRRNYREYFDDGTREQVAARYALDLQYFEYEF